MKDETIVNLFSDMSSLSFGIFSVAISIFTVLYAFILSRKDSLRELNDIIKTGNANPYLSHKVSIFIAHTNKWRAINKHMLVIIISSILIYALCIFFKYIPVTCFTKFMVKIMLVLSGILITYIGIMMAVVFKRYFKETSIN
ncbi:hypothetical protein GCM10028816_09360 [Spirosoma lituiforme]